MYKQRHHCAVCEASQLKKAVNLPNLPLTGLYIPASTDVKGLPQHIQNGLDQSLMFCEVCGHGQLLNIIDSEYIYDETYTHRGSKSAIATKGNDFFVEFLKKVASGRIFKKAIDIGCNDLYLIKKIEPLAESLVGVDPIWKNQNHQHSEKIKVLGGFVEEVDYLSALAGRPDLVISAHTFEHICDPKSVLKNIIKDAADDALFVIEVPSFDNLLRNFRFDQIFHQHVHYYSLSSFNYLLSQLGCTYIAHTCNYDFWGGTLLVAFKKSNSYSHSNRVFPKLEFKEIELGFQNFKKQLNYAMDNLKYRSSSRIYGYGAAQMLPVLAYHMESDLSFLEYIVDDNPARWGHKYPNLSCSISSLGEDKSLDESDVIITALDSARAILKKLLKMNPQRIILPLNII